MTIALHAIEDPSRFGVVQVDDRGKILRFQEKPKPGTEFSNLASMGLYILEPEILKLIPANTVYDFGHQLFPLLLEKGFPFMVTLRMVTGAMWAALVSTARRRPRCSMAR